MIKALNKSGVEGNSLNLIVCISRMPRANIIMLNGQRRDALPTIIKWLLSPLLCSIVLARAVRQELDIKGIQIGKEAVKLSFQMTWSFMYKVLRMTLENYWTNEQFQEGCNIKDKYGKSQLLFYTFAVSNPKRKLRK